MTHWGDALFELGDAALCAGAPVASVPGLSLEPEFRRSHGSLYKGLVKGHLDEERFKELVVEHRPRGCPEVFAVDASVWDRCDAECSPERGFYYSASKHSAGQPIVAGWSYHWIAQLDFSPDSWTAPLDARRIRPDEDGTAATVEQVRELIGRLGPTDTVPMFVFDAGYDPIALTAGLEDTAAQVLVRIRGDRVFYRDPPARTQHARSTPAPRQAPQTRRSAHDGSSRCRARHHRSPLRQYQGARLAQCASKDHRTRPLGG
jgi:hypothetical protein